MPTEFTQSSSHPPSPRARPKLLQPPATIISPPSPIEPKSFHPPTFSSPPQADTSDPDIEYDSPASDPSMSDGEDKDPEPRPRAASDHLGPSPLAATQRSSSPRDGAVLLHPGSPGLPSSPRASSSRPHSPRSPSPSSPHYRPRSLKQRRESSTHRVRETMDGQQTSSDDGHRMVNQYKIGLSLGKGAYAKVELGVDVGTGTEYAIKEFSKSRLHFRALQEKQRQTTRSRVKGRAGSPNLPGFDGKRKAGEGADGNEGSEAMHAKEGPEADWGMETIENDPLGLVRREIAVMKKLDHPNIVSLFEAISVPNADALFLVLEYLPGGVLMQVSMGHPDKDVKSPFSLDQTREYFRQLCLGLEYLHANEVIHRDVKPDNILLSADREVVKLCDFGVSEMFEAQGDDRIKRSGGSPAFLSPESFTTHVHDVHGRALDIWALGITLYCMVTGHLPFMVDNPIDLLEVVRTHEPALESDWESHLKDLLRRMLAKDPSQRIVMADLREHAWVTAEGEEPMIETEDNLYHIGKHVEEPTQEELVDAIGSIRGVFTVIRAIQKMRRLQLHRRSISNASQTETSTNPSLTSGSMDSYASQPSSTDATSDDAHKWKDLAGSAMLSPSEMSDGGATERQDSDPMHKTLRRIDTESKDKEGQGEVMFDSPTSDGEVRTPVMQSSK